MQNMELRHQIGTKQLLAVVSVGLLSLPLLLYGKQAFRRPAQRDLTRSLFQGIDYRREFRSTPRPQMIHIATVDLATPGVRVLVTPGTAPNNAAPDKTEIAARTTSAFVNQFNLQLAVNAAFFSPFREKTPWSYYPQSGERVNVLGQAISNGQAYSPPDEDWAVLCFSANNQAQILNSPRCPEATAHAVAGNSVLVAEGKPAEDALTDNRPYPRAAVAIDRTGQTLWLVAIDGKQPLYSEGATLPELIDLLIELGADTAINLDGGGSTTLAAATASGAIVLNAPIHTKLPLRERPVANHLGFYARPRSQR
jgi:hypothetical protein